jgi:hypothetical protein
MSEDFIIISCPHCEGSILIYNKQLRCRIFRHAIYKHNNKPIKPHLSQEQCESLIRSKKILGCGKPFKLNDKNEAEICGYL